jgi:hypothetical protein
MISALLLLVLLCGSSDGAERIGRLAHPPICEASGIVRSRKHAGIFWVHNDSGNPSALFAVRADGSLVREYRVAAPNLDWEDIATDDEGHLYIGDIGNNGGRLPLRAIYRFDEPDPAIEPARGPLRVTLATYYRFPPEGRFDAEGLVIDGGRALVVAKTFDQSEAAIYAIPLDPPAPLLRPALPEKAGTLAGFREPASGADLSPDGAFLAVCSLHVARVYRRECDSWTLVGQAHYDAGDVEAICWSGRDLILASEDRGVYRIAEATWRGKSARP